MLQNFLATLGQQALDPRSDIAQQISKGIKWVEANFESEKGQAVVTTTSLQRVLTIDALMARHIMTGFYLEDRDKPMSQQGWMSEASDYEVSEEDKDLRFFFLVSSIEASKGDLPCFGTHLFSEDELHTLIEGGSLAPTAHVSVFLVVQGPLNPAEVFEEEDKSADVVNRLTLRSMPDQNIGAPQKKPTLILGGAETGLKPAKRDFHGQIKAAFSFVPYAYPKQKTRLEKEIFELENPGKVLEESEQQTPEKSASEAKPAEPSKPVRTILNLTSKAIRKKPQKTSKHHKPHKAKKDPKEKKSKKGKKHKKKHKREPVYQSESESDLPAEEEEERASSSDDVLIDLADLLNGQPTLRPKTYLELQAERDLLRQIVLEEERLMREIEEQAQQKKPVEDEIMAHPPAEETKYEEPPKPVSSSTKPSTDTTSDPNSSGSACQIEIESDDDEELEIVEESTNTKVVGDKKSDLLACYQTVDSHPERDLNFKQEVLRKTNCRKPVQPDQFSTSSLSVNHASNRSGGVPKKENSVQTKLFRATQRANRVTLAAKTEFYSKKPAMPHQAPAERNGTIDQHFAPVNGNKVIKTDLRDKQKRNYRKANAFDSEAAMREGKSRVNPMLARHLGTTHQGGFRKKVPFVPFNQEKYGVTSDNPQGYKQYFKNKEANRRPRRPQSPEKE